MRKIQHVFGEFKKISNKETLVFSEYTRKQLGRCERISLKFQEMALKVWHFAKPICKASLKLSNLHVFYKSMKIATFSANFHTDYEHAQTCFSLFLPTLVLGLFYKFDLQKL